MTGYITGYIHHNHHAGIAQEFSYDLVKDDLSKIDLGDTTTKQVYSVMVLPKNTSDLVSTRNTLVLLGKLMESTVFNEILDYYQDTTVLHAHFSPEYLGVYYFCFCNDNTVNADNKKIATKLSQCVMKNKKELKLKIPALNWTLYKM
jgi:hypothetical protein